MNSKGNLFYRRRKSEIEQSRGIDWEVQPGRPFFQPPTLTPTPIIKPEVENVIASTHHSTTLQKPFFDGRTRTLWKSKDSKDQTQPETSLKAKYEIPEKTEKDQNEKSNWENKTNSGNETTRHESHENSFQNSSQMNLIQNDVPSQSAQFQQGIITERNDYERSEIIIPGVGDTPVIRKHFGNVTQIDKFFGMADNEVFFQVSSVDGALPVKGDRVYYEAELCKGKPFKWLAKFVKIDRNPIQSQSQSFSSYYISQNQNPSSSNQNPFPNPNQYSSLIGNTLQYHPSYSNFQNSNPSQYQNNLPYDPRLNRNSYPNFNSNPMNPPNERNERNQSERYILDKSKLYARRANPERNIYNTLSCPKTQPKTPKLIYNERGNLSLQIVQKRTTEKAELKWNKGEMKDDDLNPFNLDENEAIANPFYKNPRFKDIKVKQNLKTIYPNPLFNKSTINKKTVTTQVSTEVSTEVSSQVLTQVSTEFEKTEFEKTEFEKNGNAESEECEIVDLVEDESPENDEADQKTEEENPKRKSSPIPVDGVPKGKKVKSSGEEDEKEALSLLISKAIQENIHHLLPPQHPMSRFYKKHPKS